MEKHIAHLVGGVVERYEEHDLDSHPDFSIWLPGRDVPLFAECKNVRNHSEAYRMAGEIVAYKVETQKTRASVGVAEKCMGMKCRMSITKNLQEP